jgi:NADH-quinone oxidoreductase subunit G
MEGLRPRDPAGLLTFAWSPGWHSNQSVYKFQAEVGGPLRGGPAGIRLDVSARGDPAPVPDAAAAASPGGAMTAVLLQDVFASDELSAMAPALRQRASPPYLVLAPEDADRLGVGPGDGVRAAAGGAAVSLAVRVEDAMASGSAGLVRGAAGELFVAPDMAVTVTADPGYVPPGSGVIARG